MRRPRLPHWTIWRWTVSHQILILVAVSVLAAQAAGLIVALTLPQRPLATLAIDQATDRIKDAVRHVSGAADGEDAAREARSLSDRRLVFTVLDRPPGQTQPDPFSARMAQTLGLPADSVHAEFGLGQRRGGRRGPGPDGFGPGQPGQPGRPPAGDLQPGPPGDDSQAGPPPTAFAGPPPGAPPGPEPRAPSINQRLDRAIDQSRPPGVFRQRGGGGRQFRQGQGEGQDHLPQPPVLAEAGSAPHQ